MNSSHCQGNPEKVLSKPNSVVLTEETAQRYFGDENPVGQFISVNANTNIYEVTGICSNLPGNSHIQFDFLASLGTLDESRQTFWLNNSLATCVTLEKGSDAADVEANIPALLKKYAEPQLQEFMGISFKELEASGNYYRLILQPEQEGGTRLKIIGVVGGISIHCTRKSGRMFSVCSRKSVRLTI